MKIIWSASSFSSRWMQHIWFVMTQHALIHTCAHFWDICVCCAYNLMAHWYTPFAILILLCRQNLAKIVKVLSNRPMPSLGKMRTRAKELAASSPECFDTPEGRCGIQQSLTVGLRDMVAQLLKDGELWETVVGSVWHCCRGERPGGPHCRWETFQICMNVTCTVYRLISSSVETGSSWQWRGALITSRVRSSAEIAASCHTTSSCHQLVDEDEDNRSKFLIASWRTNA